MQITREEALDRLAKYFPQMQSQAKTAFAGEPPETIRSVLLDCVKGVLNGGTWVSTPAQAEKDLAWIQAGDWTAFASETEAPEAELLPVPAPYPTPTTAGIQPVVEALSDVVFNQSEEDTVQTVMDVDVTDLVAQAVTFLCAELNQPEWSTEQCLQYHLNVLQAVRGAQDGYTKSRFRDALNWMVEEGATEEDMAAWFEVVSQVGIGLATDEDGVWYHNYPPRPNFQGAKMEYSPKTAAKLAELPADEGGIPHPEQLYNAMPRTPKSETETPQPAPPTAKKYVVLCRFEDGYKVVYATNNEGRATEAMARANHHWGAYTKYREAHEGESERWLKAREPVPAA